MVLQISKEPELSGFSNFVVLSENDAARFYRADDLVLGKSVVVKVLKISAATEQNSLEQFKLESQKLAGIEHESIARVRRFGVLSCGAPFILMDFVNGKRIREFMSFTVMPEAVFGTVFGQVFSALAEAEKHGFVLENPDDIMVSFEQQAASATTTFSKSASRYRCVLFNLKHLPSAASSAEQLCSRALIGIMFQSLTGNHVSAFKEDSQLVAQIKSSKLSAAMKQFFLKALNKNSEKSFRGNEEIASYLRQLSEIRTGNTYFASRKITLVLAMLSSFLLIVILCFAGLKHVGQGMRLQVKDEVVATSASIKSVLAKSNDERDKGNQKEALVLAFMAANAANAKHDLQLEDLALKEAAILQSRLSDNLGAIKTLERRYKIARRYQGERQTIATLNEQKAGYLMEMRKFPEAIKLFEQNIDMRLNWGNQRNIRRDYFNLAQCYFASGQQIKADFYLEKAWDQLRETCFLNSYDDYQCALPYIAQLKKQGHLGLAKTRMKYFCSLIRKETFFDNEASFKSMAIESAKVCDDLELSVEAKKIRALMASHETTGEQVEEAAKHAIMTEFIGKH